MQHLPHTIRSLPPYPVAISGVVDYPASSAIGPRSRRCKPHPTQVRIPSSATPSLPDETSATVSFQQPQQTAPPSSSSSATVFFDNRPYLEGLKSLETRLEVMERVVSFTRSDMKTIMELMLTNVEKISDLISRHQGCHQDVLAAIADIKVSNEEVRTYFDSLPLNLPQCSGQSKWREWRVSFYSNLVDLLTLLPICYLFSCIFYRCGDDLS
jgi:hypothetical protein